MMFRWAFAVIAACSGAAAAFAEGEPGLMRRLEPRWQTEIPADAGLKFSLHKGRIAVAGDGRVSFGLKLGSGSVSDEVVRAVLVTVAGSGEILQRPTIGDVEPDAPIVALAGGDFVVQAANPGRRNMLELRRHAADGRLLFRSIRKLGAGEQNNRLLDALALANGRTITMSEIGLGPNDTLIVDVLDPAGRSVWSYRMRVRLGSEFYSRLYMLTPDSRRERVAISANGAGRLVRDPPYNTVLQSIALAGRTGTVAKPVTLANDGEMRCSALVPDGRAVLGIVPSEATSTILRWYNDSGRPVTSRTFAGADPCVIAMRADGVSLVSRAPRQIMIFAADGAPQWRAELPADADMIAWMPEGDVFAIHGAESGVRFVRYAPR